MLDGLGQTGQGEAFRSFSDSLHFCTIISDLFEHAATNFYEIGLFLAERDFLYRSNEVKSLKSMGLSVFFYFGEIFVIN